MTPWRIPAFAIVLALTLLPISAVSATKVTPGSTCKTAKQKIVYQNKVFTCTQVGKKRVWSKGVAVVKETPAPTPTPTPTPTPAPTPSPTPTPTPTQEVTFAPWSEKFEVSDMYRQALKKTKEFFPTDQKVEPSLEMIFQDTIPQKEMTSLKDIANVTHSIFFPVTKQSTVLIFGTSHAWVGEQAKNRNLPIYSAQYPCGGDGSWDRYCANDNLGMMIYSGRYDEAKKKLGNDLGLVPGNYGVVTHEYFHTVQTSLSARDAFNPGSSNYIPVWLKEGSANFVGFAVLDYLKIYPYEGSRYTEVESHQSYSNVQSKAALEKYSTYSSSNQGVALDPYGIGMAATEYLVASVGFESLLNVFKYTKESNNFEQSFSKAVGISLQDFYRFFEAARPNLKIGNQ